MAGTLAVNSRCSHTLLALFAHLSPDCFFPIAVGTRVVPVFTASSCIVPVFSARRVDRERAREQRGRRRRRLSYPTDLAAAPMRHTWTSPKRNKLQIRSLLPRARTGHGEARVCRCSRRSVICGLTQACLRLPGPPQHRMNAPSRRSGFRVHLHVGPRRHRRRDGG